ncbi:MAG: BlaI/MecI/CopY family transcriptional regulator, partial [Oscillospiraceae bacterium]|nr:BlaI/MecI/CopY family transcriptional regulator [Oscillospiraceae bacterium]
MEKLFDAELRLMELLWEHAPISAKEISLLAAEKLDWNKNTTYTVIKRLIEKQVVRRDEPNFICTCLINRDAVQKAETNTLIERLFGGSKKAFFAAFADETLSPDEVEALRSRIEK